MVAAPQEEPTILLRVWACRVYPLLLLLLSFFLRATFLVGSSTLWHARAKAFFEALLAGDLAGTYQAPHPGVTTMWLAALARQAALLFNPDFDGMSVVKRLNIEIVPSALIISLAILLAYILLEHIFDFQVAAFAALLLALDPFHISLSKVIHVDALLSTFMLLSALFLWLFLKDSRWPWVFFSGVFAGLGLLTKTPAIFLVPYLFLCLLVWQGGLWRQKRSSGVRYDWFLGLRKSILLILVWLAALSVTYLLSWPSMWVQPFETLALSFGGTNFYRVTPHENPVFLLGKATISDPGPLFYPINMAIKTTAVSLTGFALSFFVLIRGRMKNYQRQAILLGFAFVFFFILMLTLGDKKLSRYILPALQFVTLLAGIGWVYSLRMLWHDRVRLLQLSLLLVAAVQLLAALAHFPYFGTHYNYLLGGPQRIFENEVVAGQEFGIGVERAADSLNQLPLSTELVVGAHNWLDFYHYFQGKTVPMTDDKVDYLLFTRNWTIRGMEAHKWQPLWDEYRLREPKYVISFDGVPYVWVYKTGSIIDEELIAYPVVADLGRRIRLLGYDFSPEEVRPGESVKLTLYWESLEPHLEDFTVFAHLLDPGGQLRGQRDSQPQNGMYPTYLWDQGERIQDELEIVVDAEAPPGNHTFAVGMYLLQTLERLPVLVETGEEQPDGRLLLPGPQVLSDR